MKSEEFATAMMICYKREGGPLHTKSYNFAVRLHIALKEANETMNWLNLLHDTDILDDKGFESLANDCNEVISLLVSSIKTIKKNNNL